MCSFLPVKLKDVKFGIPTSMSIQDIFYRDLISKIADFDTNVQLRLISRISFYPASPPDLWSNVCHSWCAKPQQMTNF